MILRALAIWLLLAVLAVSAGIAREGLLTPRIGSGAAHVVGTFVVVAAFFVAIGLSIRWIVPDLATASLGLVGGVWLVLTAAFEFGFGHYVAGHSWSRLFRDYDVLAGRIWILVLLTVLLAPVWLGRLRAGGSP